MKNLKLREFDWVSGDRKRSMCGFVAQEIEEDLGEEYVLKVPQNDGGVNYQINSYEFIPLLTKGIQELNAKIKRLENEVANLKGETLQ
jgi:hypothetical protein